jgi:hypothetical protein
MKSIPLGVLLRRMIADEVRDKPLSAKQHPLRRTMV